MWSKIKAEILGESDSDSDEGDDDDGDDDDGDEDDGVAPAGSHAQMTQQVGLQRHPLLSGFAMYFRLPCGIGQWNSAPRLMRPCAHRLCGAH